MATTLTTRAVESSRAKALVWTLTGATAENGPASPDLSNYRDRCVHVFGTFNSSQIAVEGSNDPRVLSDPGNAVWTVLTDPQGNNLSGKTAAFLEQIQEAPRFVRVTKGNQGDANTSVTAVIIVGGGLK
jgi:hypothetical protein